MKERSRIYYYFIIGAGGGLTGWFTSTLLLRVFNIPTPSIRSEFFYGGILGAFIGIAVAAYDGITNRSVRRFIKYGGRSLAFGAFAGALALPLMLWLHDFLLKVGDNQANVAAWLVVLIGTFCWLIFGGLIGLGESIGKGTQSWKGILGGLIGGLGGGLLHEINRTLGGSGQDFNGQVYLALSLMLLGGAISALIALVAEVLKDAWLDVLNGKLAGERYYVNKYVDPKPDRHQTGVIGSDQWKAQIYLPGDSEVLPYHAEINFTNGAPTLTLMPAASKRAKTFINGRRLIDSSPLSNGDELQFGSTNLIYRQKRRARKPTRF